MAVKRLINSIFFTGPPSGPLFLGERLEEPRNFINYLSESSTLSPHKTLRCLESLQIALTFNPISWIKEFGEVGIDAINTLLQKCGQARDIDYDKIELECIRCFKAVVNISWGMDVVLGAEMHPVIISLAKCLDSKKPNTMIEALQLLAGFCLVTDRNGYDKVLRAISISADKSGERFRNIVDGLFVEADLGDTKRDVCCSSLIFINTITNSPSDLNFRFHLRCEIMRMGLHERLDFLTDDVNNSDDDNLKKHFKIFKETRDDDFEELSRQFDSARLELDDMNGCFEVLKNLVADSPSEPYFLSILQHLLFIRDDSQYRVAYFQLIEECVSQIVLYKNGCDPNFENRNFHIDTEVMLEDLVEKQVASEILKVVEYEKKLETLQTHKQEAEARASNLEEKIKHFEAMIAANLKDSAGPAEKLLGNRKPLPNSEPGAKVLPTPTLVAKSLSPPPPPTMGPPSPTMAPPPPPPMNLSQSGPLPHDMKPKRKWKIAERTKRANWNIIRPREMAKDAFWVHCQEENLVADDILASLAKKFSKRQIKKKENATAAMPNTKNFIESKVLDDNATKSLSLILGTALKRFTHAEIKTALLKCDTGVVDAHVLQIFISVLLKDDVLKKLQVVKKTGVELSVVENFALKLSEIKRLDSRLHSLHFKLGLPDMISSIKEDIVAAAAACEEVKTSKKFAKVLELILLFGNYLNTGSKNGEAHGYEIEFLTKITNTKDCENKQTLLHFVVDTIEAKFPDALTFHEDLSHVTRAANVTLETVQKTMRKMNTSLKDIESDLNKNKVPQSDDDKFIDVMSDFAVQARQQFELLDKMRTHMEDSYKNLGEYFSFNVKKYSMKEFFSDINTFMDLFVEAYKDNVKIRESVQRNERIRETKERAQRNLQDRQQRKLALTNATHKQEGVMDSLLEALQTESTFGNRDRRRKSDSHDLRREKLRAQLNRAKLSRTMLLVAGVIFSCEVISNEIVTSASA